MKVSPYLILPSFCLLICSPSFAQTVWDGGQGDDLWSSDNNWSTDASPSGTDVQFGDTDAAATSTAVSNIVDGSVSVNSLLYNQNTTNPVNDNHVWQHTQINSGQTLTVNGDFTVGGLLATFGSTESPVTTNTKISGDGSLVVNNASASFQVYNGRSTGGVGNPTATLDLSELASFQATVSVFGIGHNITQGDGTIILSNNSTVTADIISAGTSGNSSNSPTLLLGSSNTLHADTFAVGATTPEVTFNRSSGSMQFDASVASGTGTVEIRAKDGVSRADMNIGTMRINTSGGTGGNGSPVGVVDFGDHTVDALIGTLILGSSSANNSASSGATGTLTMGAGTMDVTTAIVGQNGFGSNGTSLGGFGYLNVNGGSFTADELYLAYNRGNWGPQEGTVTLDGGSITANEVFMGLKDGGAGASLEATFNITGGTLNMNGALHEIDNRPDWGDNPGDTITSELTLNGGTINMNGNDITVDTFTAQSGTLNGLGELYHTEYVETSPGSLTWVTEQVVSNLTKSGSGTLTLTGTNAYTGDTLISEGILAVDGSLTNSNVTVQNGGTLGGSGTISGTVAVETGGTLAPGNSPGTLATGALTLDSGATLSIEIDGSSLYDQVMVTGLVDLGSAADLAIVLGYAPANGDEYIIIDNDSNDSISGSFLTVNGEAFGAGNSFTLDYNSETYSFLLSYVGGSGNDLMITAVPEPATYAAIFGGLACLLVCLRRRKR